MGRFPQGELPAQGARRIFAKVVLQYAPVTGAPIYLVSACTSGEEFVAAFRRYADKNGLFVPIREPLAIGRRGRFAVTLRDGGVMIEGKAEIISSARTASILHGRVGMTLRFVVPDEASKIMLGELEKARLAMRPAPPSMAPRPAELPAEPRPVPPPVQGRIDAVNALAECVAIGDPDALGPAAATAAMAAPPRAGPRFVAPVAPPRESLRKGPERRADPAQAVPSISGFSETMTAVVPIADPGPTSDTIVAASPPEPSAAPSTASPTPPRRAVEMPVAPLDDDASALTQIHAGAPLPPRGPAAVLPHEAPAIGVAPTPRGASPARPLPAMRRPAPPIVAPERWALPEVEIADPTDLSPGPPELPLPDTVPPKPPVAPAPRQRKTEIGVAVVPPGVVVLPATLTLTADVTSPIAVPVAAPPTPPPAGAPAPLPTGDWAIALDPQAPDGWSAPVKAVSAERVAGAPPPSPPLAIVVEAQPRDAAPKRPPPRSDEPPIAEPKVQVDPMLIEPLRPMPSDQPLQPMPPDGPLPFLVPHGPPGIHTGQVPRYPPMAGPRTAVGSGPGDPRYASETALPVPSGSRRAIIVIASAVMAVAIGIVVLLAFSRKHAPGASADRASTSPAPAPVAPPKAAKLAPPPIEPAHPEPPAAAPDHATTAAADPVAGATSPDPSTCFAEVSSVPTGAQIVLDRTNVIGTTPRKVALPCGDKVELLIRKRRLVPATRSITPTPEGVKLKVALAKQMYLVKVSSTPSGATVTMNGKSLGVTPTTVKLPAFEASTLALSKDGHATATAKVTPRSNGAAVHTALTKLDRKKPR